MRKRNARKPVEPKLSTVLASILLSAKGFTRCFRVSGLASGRGGLQASRSRPIRLAAMTASSILPPPGPVTPLRRSSGRAGRAEVSYAELSEYDAASMSAKAAPVTPAQPAMDESMVTPYSQETSRVYVDDTPASTMASSPSSSRGASPMTPVKEEELNIQVDIQLDESAVAPAPKKARKPRAKKVKAEAVEAAPGEEMAAAADDPLKKPTRKRKAKDVKPVIDGAASDDSALTPLSGEDEKPKKTKKARKPRAPKPEPVYDIPDLLPEQKKTTTFKGRLGYACLCTVMRNKKPDPVFCARTCRIDTIKKEGMDYLKEIGRQNMRDLAELIEWNEQHHIRFLRLSSEMFPFASHQEYGFTLEFADEELKAAGALANKYGHRLTTHPGQFTQLGSPRPNVVENAVRDLTYHCEMLDRMGMGKDSVMIIHGGGVYGDKEAALARFRVNYREKLSQNIRDRLVLENDEICYNCDDLLPMCEELGIPLVLDYHHDWIYPSSQPVSELIPRIQKLWDAKGIKPKQHLSEPRPGAVSIMERRAHADRCQTLPADLPDDMDLMIEAKDKEQAVFHLFRVYDLAPTIYKSLRPPAEVETLRTNGRKSHSPKKKAKVEAEEGLEDPEAALDGDSAAVDGVAPLPEPAALEGAEETAKPKRKRASKGKGKAKADEVPPAEAKPAEAELVEEQTELQPEEAKPKRKRAPRKKAHKKTAAAEEPLAALEQASVAPAAIPADTEMQPASLAA
ncbi:uncharacterized protein L969DRAFT_82497 [Mixia osmundae IAM 14324]|uniref:UV-endonuclease UvdE n=1 Tax=Mixia osmundae (strain CBS 9802 / IAM 14324 / JCM 22182 / KY 12970) TaxID=764103 RepID=G7E750_MIXOS|nr:uncharacterized protein L969DRAFT_82497 [Mixia osmundae IAM 14324]KEI38953.1 hypothetical protein L969DRAFT_82497 [Mixia osmundae IAM 14324]GAA98660.1 hypothetical protein E5Q_05348 [Mixia osmundae IAM 14324]